MTHKKKQIFSPGIRIIISAMAVDFIAWGIIDTFFSALARSLFDNLFLIGLLVSVKALSSLISLAPFSKIIEIKSPKYVSILGRVGTVISVLFYIFSGLLSLPYLLFVGSFLHGISGAARDIATRDYLIKNTNKEHASTVLGASFSSRYATWTIAAMVSGYIIVFLASGSPENFSKQIPLLFFIVLPFFLISILLLERLPKEHSVPFPYHAISPKAIFSSEKRLFQRFFQLTGQIQFSMLLICFLQIIRNSLLLFLPILALDMNLSITHIGLLMASMHAPMLLSAIFSIFEDRTDRMLFIIGGLIFSVFPLLLLSQAQAPILIGISAILISLSLSVITPANLGNIAAHTQEKDSAQISAMQITFQRFGMLFGSLIIGLVSQIFGIASAFLLIAVLAITFAITAIVVRMQYREEKKIEKEKISHAHPLHPHLLHIHHTV
jgi:MFS family permease